MSSPKTDEAFRKCIDTDNDAIRVTGVKPTEIELTADNDNDDLSDVSKEYTVTGDYINCSRDLPAANGENMYVGWRVSITNNTGKFFLVYNSDKSKLWFIPDTCTATFTCLSTASIAGIWDFSCSGILPEIGRDVSEFYAIESKLRSTTPTSGTSGATVTSLSGYNNILVGGCRTGTDTAGWAKIYYQDAMTNAGYVGPSMFQKTIALDALSTASEEYAQVFGWGDSFGTITIGKGVYIIYDRNNALGFGSGISPNYRLVCKDASPTHVLSSVAVATPMITLTIIQSSTERVDFYAGANHLGTITTNIPTIAASGPTLFIQKSAGATSREVKFHNTRLAQTYSTRL